MDPLSTITRPAQDKRPRHLPCGCVLGEGEPVFCAAVEALLAEERAARVAGNGVWLLRLVDRWMAHVE